MEGGGWFGAWEVGGEAGGKHAVVEVGVDLAAGGHDGRDEVEAVDGFECAGVGGVGGWCGGRGSVGWVRIVGLSG